MSLRESAVSSRHPCHPLRPTRQRQSYFIMPKIELPSETRRWREFNVVFFAVAALLVWINAAISGKMNEPALIERAAETFM